MKCWGILKSLKKINVFLHCCHHCIVTHHMFHAWLQRWHLRLSYFLSAHWPDNNEIGKRTQTAWPSSTAEGSGFLVFFPCPWDRNARTCGDGRKSSASARDRVLCSLLGWWSVVTGRSPTLPFIEKEKSIIWQPPIGGNNDYGRKHSWISGAISPQL